MEASGLLWCSMITLSSISVPSTSAVQTKSGTRLRRSSSAVRAWISFRLPTRMGARDRLGEHGEQEAFDLRGRVERSLKQAVVQVAWLHAG